MAHRYGSCVALYSNGPLKSLVQCGCKFPTSSNGLKTLHRRSYTYLNASSASRHSWSTSTNWSPKDQKWKCSSVNYKLQYISSPATSSYICLYQDLLFLRPYHSTSSLWKEESKVEQSVKVLKEGGKNSVKDEAEVHVQTETEGEKAIVERRTFALKVQGWWQSFVGFCKHHWNGFKLLCIDIKVCSHLLFGVLPKRSLTRREYRQLVRTAADLFRLVPFLVFLIIPFMEFLLPVALKLFPNMLPSTFQHESSEKEKLKKQLKLKLEMAKFLQDTVKESAPQGMKKGAHSSVMDFSDFMSKIRSTGEQASTEEIMKYSKLFENEITLDNMSRKQIQALCVVLGVSRMGPDPLLRIRLNVRLRELKQDDEMIQKEGIDSLTIWELQDACRSRGMRALGIPGDRLKSQLQQWIELHVGEKIPASLLLLSRAMYLPETLTTTEQLQASLSALPENTEVEAKIKIAEVTGEAVDNKTRIEHIKQMEQAIKLEQEEQLKRSEAEALALKAATEALEAQEEKEKVDIAEPIEPKPSEEFKPEVAVDEEITTEDLHTIETAIEEIAEKKEMDLVAEELQDLKEDVEEYVEDVQDLREIVVASGGDVNLEESKGARRLMKRVSRLMAQSDSIINTLHKEKAHIQEEIEVGEVKMKRNPELKEDESKLEEMQQTLKEKKVNLISLNELVLGLKRLQKIPDDTRLQRIVEVLDEDRDGNIDVSHVLKVIEVLSKENLKLSATHVSEVVDLLKKQDLMLEDEKIKEKEEKEMETLQDEPEEDAPKEQQEAKGS